ncbi:MAG: response regulator [Gemmatimonadota bacterium]
MHALIVDDSRAMRTLIGRMMNQLGFETSFAGNGKEALDRLQGAVRPDVALVDWNMPEMNGFELLQAVRGSASFNTMPLVMVTSETEMSQVSKALEHGASEYVMKPFTADILREKLELLGLVTSE